MAQPTQPDSSQQPQVVYVQAPPEKKPFWKKKWFIVLAVIIVLIIAVQATGDGSKKSDPAADAGTSAGAESAADGDSKKPEPAAGEAASPAAAANSSNVHNVTFTVTSNTATKADVTITSLDAKGNIQQQQENGVALPYTKTIEIDASVIFDASNANILAQVKDGEDITASVQIDDNKPSTSTSTGEYATVVASASS